MRRVLRAGRRLAAVLLSALLAAMLAPLHAAPVVVLDDLGRRIELPRPAQRIAALSPHLVEQLAAIGALDRVVATSEFADYPEGARSIARVSRAGSVDLERLAAARPDLVLVWGGGSSPAMRAAIERLGLPVYVAEARELEHIASSMERLGKLSAAPRASQAAAQFRREIEVLRQRWVDAAPLRVFFQVWDPPLMTVGGRQVITQAIGLCGGQNVFASLDPLAPVVSREAVLATDPQLIVAAEPGGIARAELARGWSAYPQLSAVKRQAFVTLDADRINRAGPRLPAEIARLCEAIERVRRLP